MRDAYKVILLDYYGTLVKIEEPFEQIRKWIIDMIGEEIPVYTYMLRWYAKLTSDSTYIRGDERLVRSLQYACTKFQVNVDIEAFRSFLFLLFGSAIAYPDAHDVIAKLKKRYVVGIASNADNYIINESISRNNFKFDFIITSEDAKAEKPSSKFFSYVLKKIGVEKSDVILVGDSWKDDILGSEKAGIDCIWLNQTAEKEQRVNTSLKAKVTSLTEIIYLLEDADFG